jgi:bifunctional DNA-binding transcriptional regulator/antitoxin component of YhaV-PrlF toxin-antitoxin module
VLAKITSKHQITLPKSVVQAVEPTEYFEVEVRAGQIILTPVRIQRGDAVRAKLAELDLTHSEFAAAVAAAREQASARAPGSQRVAGVNAGAKPMRSTLTINSRGVITLPANLRQAKGLTPDDQLSAETMPDGLLLRPTATLPVEMYSPTREQESDPAEAELATALARRSSHRAKQR